MAYLTTIKHNLLQVIIGVDQFLTVLLLTVMFPTEKVYADETFSSQAFRWNKHGRRQWVMKLIDKVLGKGHCQSAYDSELTRRHISPEQR